MDCAAIRILGSKIIVHQIYTSFTLLAVIFCKKLDGPRNFPWTLSHKTKDNKSSLTYPIGTCWSGAFFAASFKECSKMKCPFKDQKHSFHRSNCCPGIEMISPPQNSSYTLYVVYVVAELKFRALNAFHTHIVVFICCYVVL